MIQLKFYLFNRKRSFIFTIFYIIIHLNLHVKCRTEIKVYNWLLVKYLIFSTYNQYINVLDNFQMTCINNVDCVCQVYSNMSVQHMISTNHHGTSL